MAVLLRVQSLGDLVVESREFANMMNDILNESMDLPDVKFDWLHNNTQNRIVSAQVPAPRAFHQPLQAQASRTPCAASRHARACSDVRLAAPAPQSSGVMSESAAAERDCIEQEKREEIVARSVMRLAKIYRQVCSVDTRWLALLVCGGLVRLKRAQAPGTAHSGGGAGEGGGARSTDRSWGLRSQTGHAQQWPPWARRGLHDGHAFCAQLDATGG